MANIETLTPQQQQLQVIKSAGQNDFISFCEIADPKGYIANWHHEIICRKLQENYEKMNKGISTRLVLELPPRHGKSRTATMLFPAWALGKDPSLPIIVSAHTAELAEDFGSETRGVMEFKNYKAVFGTRLRADTKAKGHWATKEGGSYLAVGVGGPITGRGFCFPAGTLVTTDKGKVPIECCNDKTRVLSWNHEKNKLEWKEVRRTFRRVVRGFTKITTTQGDSLIATNDHPVFISGKGYIEAKNIKEGDGIFQIAESSNFGMYIMPQRISKDLVRVYQKSKERIYRYVLRKRMFGKTSCSEKQASMQAVWSKAIRNKKISFLFSMPKMAYKEIKNYSVWFLREAGYSTFQIYQILLNGLQKRLSFQIPYGKGQSKLQTWKRNEQVSEGVSENKIQNKEKSESEMYYLQTKQRIGNPSSGLQSKEQQERKSNFSLQDAPYHSSQIQKNSISHTSSFEKEQEVYDIEVEENHNFFANGFLVHNCIGIIDDPIKNREEADSETVRNKIWNWYTSTFLTRQEGATMIVIIMTRWHLDDLVGRIEENEMKSLEAGIPHDEWEYITFPAIAEDDEKFRKKGEPLWGEKVSLQNLLNLRNSVGPYDWSALFQQNPIPSENQEFKEKFFRYFEQKEINTKDLEYITVIDPAISEKETADNSVVLTIGKERNSPNIYRVEETAGHFNPDQLVDIIFSHYEKYKSRVWLETIAFQKALKYAIVEKQRKSGIYFTIKELKNNRRMAKVIRIRGLVPLYGAGVIFHRRSDVEFERELLQFPSGKRDDRIDCMANILEALEEKHTTESGGAYEENPNPDPYA